MPYLVPPVVPSGWMSSRPQPAVPSGGLVLRPWCERDAEVIIAAYADESIQRWHARTVESPQEALDLIDEWMGKWVAETAARWAVVDATAHEVVGQVALRSIDLQEGEAEVSYWVMPGSRQVGVATASVRALSRWAFDELGLHRLELHHSVLNPASCGVASNAGFVLEGTMHQKAGHVDGRHDMHLHARLRDQVADGPA